MIRLAFVLLPLLVLAGCVGYQPVDQVDREVALAPVLNEDGPPGLTGPVSRSLREKLGASPNWNLLPAENAAAVLHVTLTTTERDVLANDPADTGRPLSYRQTVEVRLRWEGGAPPWGGSSPERVLHTQIQLFAQPSLVEAGQSALPDLADRLARRIVQELEWSRFPGE
ncbi:MAG: hypothetical protein GVY10_03215 [Verrucomicrobia bacterium]|jgi:hypothetical protein|nr:hypothetical protein [Verrucomicrobiota bacterium]